MKDPTVRIVTTYGRPRELVEVDGIMMQRLPFGPYGYKTISEKGVEIREKHPMEERSMSTGRGGQYAVKELCLNQELQDEFIAVVEKVSRVGLPIEEIGNMLGLAPSYFKRQMALEQDEREGTRDGRIPLMNRIRKAIHIGRVNSIKDCLSKIKRAANNPKYWKAAAWQLETLYPEYFSPVKNTIDDLREQVLKLQTALATVLGMKVEELGRGAYERVISAATRQGDNELPAGAGQEAPSGEEESDVISVAAESRPDVQLELAVHEGHDFEPGSNDQGRDQQDDRRPSSPVREIDASHNSVSGVSDGNGPDANGVCRSV